MEFSEFLGEDPVLTSPAIEILRRQDFLSADSNDLAQWDIKPLPYCPDLDLQYIKFHNDKIPKYFDHRSIFDYLGFRKVVGQELWFKLYLKGSTTRSAIMALCHNHINTKWEFRSHLNATMGTPMAETVMSEMDLIPEVRAEVNTLYLESDRKPMILQEYFDNNHKKNIDNLQIVDFVHVLLDLRMRKLGNLDKVVLDNSPSTLARDSRT